MAFFSRFSAKKAPYTSERTLPEQSFGENASPVDVILNAGPVSNLPLEVLAREAAAGRRGAAWQLLHWVEENDGRTIAAIMDTLDDDRLARYLLEWIALGTWAGKSFVVPATLRAPSARMHLYTVFQSSKGTHPSRAERVLIEALHDERSTLRQTAAKILALLRSDSAAPALIEALHDPIEAVRLQVVKALGCIKSPEAVPALISLLQHADEQFLQYPLTDRRNKENLTSLPTSPGAGHSNRAIPNRSTGLALGNQIFAALGQIGPAAVPPLIELSKDNSSWVRWHSIRALGETNDLRALPILVQALADDTDYSVAWVAAKGLIQFGRLSVGPVLRLLMFNEVTPWLVGTASYVLNHQHDPNLDPYIRPVLQEMHQPGFGIGTMLAAQKALSDLVADGLGEECGLTEKSVP